MVSSKSICNVKITFHLKLLRGRKITFYPKLLQAVAKPSTLKGSDLFSRSVFVQGLDVVIMQIVIIKKNIIYPLTFCKH